MVLSICTSTVVYCKSSHLSPSFLQIMFGFTLFLVAFVAVVLTVEANTTY